MKGLLDTHAFLWWITDDARLSAAARSFIQSASLIYLSAASGWEIATKYSPGKLPLPDQPDVFVPEHMSLNDFRELPDSMAHALRVHSLPPIHRDPFDRILVAQSLAENFPVITADPLVTQYGVQVVW